MASSETSNLYLRVYKPIMSDKIWDITPAIHPEMPIWPGDTAFSETRTWEIEDDCPVNVSKVTMSTHTGAHADAPMHYEKDGAPIGAISLAPYIGPCQVIDVRGSGSLIFPEQIKDKLKEGIERVIFRTYDWSPQDSWDDKFTAIDASTIVLLNRRGVRLVGIDTPSIDPYESKTMDAHHAVKRSGMSILEGLVLDDVTSGLYELIALPLKFANLDAAPVRAILRNYKNGNGH